MSQSKKWFGFDDLNHPGVKQFISRGNYIISGKPYLIKKSDSSDVFNYALSPIKSRNLFNIYGWSDIIGFHTRNVPHQGHLFIQKKALSETNADGLFISPVTGLKKSGDFTANVILQCYEKLINNKEYDPYGALIGSFNPYSRYCGPKEAVFTAICRKNLGCNYFIVGRDHTGISEYYSNNASKRIFDQFDLGMKILFFEIASYCPKRDIVTDDFQNNKMLIENKIDISGTLIRNYISNGEKIPEYLIHSNISAKLDEMFRNDPDSVFI